MSEEQLEQLEVDLLNRAHRRWRNRPQGVRSVGFRRYQRTRQSKVRR